MDSLESDLTDLNSKVDSIPCHLSSSKASERTRASSVFLSRLPTHAAALLAARPLCRQVIWPASLPLSLQHDATSAKQTSAHLVYSRAPKPPDTTVRSARPYLRRVSNIFSYTPKNTDVRIRQMSVSKRICLSTSAVPRMMHSRTQRSRQDICS